MKTEARTHNSVYVSIAGEVVNQNSVLLINFTMDRKMVASNPLLHIHAKRWKKLAFWDGVGALKGAWEFGKLGFVLGGGAGAFVVGATGAIFEGASASAAAYLEDRVESFFGL